MTPLPSPSEASTAPVATVVSLTPLTAQHDSRTFRAASAFARAGYRSILAEGQPSDPTFRAPFEVLTLRTASKPPRAHIVTETLAWARAGADVPRADLYYVCSFLPWIAVSRRWARRRVPMIYDAQDYYPDLMGTGLAASMHRIEERLAIRAADTLVTSSVGMAAAYERHYGRRPAVVRNVQDTSRDIDVDRDVRRVLGLDHSAFLVVVPVAERAMVAVEAMIEAFVELPEHVHLAFVGYGHRSRGEGLVATLGLDERVHFVEPVHTTEVTAFIRSADAACVPYRNSHPTAEAILPNSAFHGTAAGLPLMISTDLTEANALFGDAGVPFDPSRPASIAEGVRTLMNASSPARALAVQQFAETVTWEREELVLLDVARRLLQKH